jgi:hypothetical protein
VLNYNVVSVELVAYAAELQFTIFSIGMWTFEL